MFCYINLLRHYTSLRAYVLLVPITALLFLKSLRLRRKKAKRLMTSHHLETQRAFMLVEISPSFLKCCVTINLTEYRMYM